jgi:protein involved in polysaccharide export with SLBB domain
MLTRLVLALSFVCAALSTTAANSPKRKESHQAITTPSIFVVGEVQAKGQYPWTNGLTLLDSLEHAGGYSSFADHTRIEIRSSGTTTQFVSFDAAVSSPAKNPKLKAGDVVWVPRNQMQDMVRDTAARVGVKIPLPEANRMEPFVFVEGEVRRPGQLPWTNQMRLSAAIELVGGLTEMADPTRLRVRHFNGGVDPANYLDATNSSLNNNYLLKGDRIIVPRKEVSN